MSDHEMNDYDMSDFDDYDEEMEAEEEVLGIIQKSDEEFANELRNSDQKSIVHTHAILLDAKNDENDLIMTLMGCYSTYYSSRNEKIGKIMNSLGNNEQLKIILLEMLQEEHIGRWRGEMLPGLDSAVLEEERGRQRNCDILLNKNIRNHADLSLSSDLLIMSKEELKDSIEKHMKIKEKCAIVDQIRARPTFSQPMDIEFEAAPEDQPTSSKRSSDLDLDENAPSEKKMRLMD
ncbi:hypothetical protein CAEBREN_00494 [Caenorhabditis brenneri]|uniref:Uncharacterized protein n=1 Tax=Caenorhabditis brenneri TaxID=135651 RepID=G0MCP7_CAEBE|nr:hypothetical protein CAEBREN_00494 [Caenorhabditis brenneri]